jgi:hypothetical protein
MTDEKPGKGKTAIPQPFEITDQMRSWARVNAPHVDLEAATAEMVDYSLGRDWRMKDWTATWRSWIRKGVKASQGQRREAAPTRSRPAPNPASPASSYGEPCGYQAAAKRLALKVLFTVGSIPEPARPAFNAKVRELGKRFAEVGKDTPMEQQRDILDTAEKWLTGLCRKAQRAAGWSEGRPGSPTPGQAPAGGGARAGTAAMAGQDGQGVPWLDPAGVEP